MASHTIYLSLFAFIALCILFHSSNAQNSPKDYLDAHNAARRQVSVPDVIWNTTLETYAIEYANQRILDCSITLSGGPYGENLFAGSDSSFTGVSAVDYWVAEQQFYDYTSNSCIGGDCLSYTQVVWRDTISIGCARVGCATGWYFVMCSYYRQGNLFGERPY